MLVMFKTLPWRESDFFLRICIFFFLVLIFINTKLTTLNWNLISFSLNFCSVFIFKIFSLSHMVCRILGPPPGTEPTPLALEVLTLNHWTARVQGLLNFWILTWPCKYLQKKCLQNFRIGKKLSSFFFWECFYKSQWDFSCHMLMFFANLSNWHLFS